MQRYKRDLIDLLKKLKNEPEVNPDEKYIKKSKTKLLKATNYYKIKKV